MLHFSFGFRFRFMISCCDQRLSEPDRPQSTKISDRITDQIICMNHPRLHLAVTCAELAKRSELDSLELASWLIYSVIMEWLSFILTYINSGCSSLNVTKVTYREFNAQRALIKIHSHDAEIWTFCFIYQFLLLLQLFHQQYPHLCRRGMTLSRRFSF